MSTRPVITQGPRGPRAAEGMAIGVRASGLPDAKWTWGESSGGDYDEDYVSPVGIELELVDRDGARFVTEFTSALPRRVHADALVRRVVRWSRFVESGDVAGRPRRRILGAHLITDSRADGITLGRFVVSCATLEDDGTFQGPQDYRSLRAVAPADVRMVAHPRAGETFQSRGSVWNIVPEGRHYLPVRSMFVREFALLRKTSRLAPFAARRERARALDALDLGGVRYPIRFENYGPSKATIEMQPGREEWWRQRVLALRAAIAKGKARPDLLLRSDAMGPFFPYSGPAADEVGGEGIEPISGWGGGRWATVWHGIVLGLTLERTDIAMFRAKDGAPVGPESWRVLGSWGGYWQPFEYRLTRGGQPIEQIPAYRSANDRDSGWCPYFAERCAYGAFDDAHFWRLKGHLMARWWLAADEVARLVLELATCDARTSWSLTPTGPNAQEWPGQYLPFSLALRLHQTSTKAGQGRGGFYGRAFGEILDTAACSYAAGPTWSRPSRADLGEWLGAMLELAARVRNPDTGTCYSGWAPSSDNGIPWFTHGMDQRKQELPTFQVPILAHGVLAAHLATELGEREAVKSIVAGSALALWCNPNLKYVPSEYAQSGPPAGPPWYLVVGVDGVPVKEIVEGVGFSHWMHGPWHLAEAIRIDPENIALYLDAMRRVGGPAATLASRLAGWRSNPDRTFTAEAIVVLQDALAGGHS